MDESEINIINDCRDQLEEISTELGAIAQTKKTADKIDRLIRDIETILDEAYDSND